MKFRGLSPLTSYARWGLVGVALGIAIGATAPQAVNLLSASVASRANSLPWTVSRLVAFLAYGAVTGSVIYGLLLSTKLLDAIAHRPITFTLHKDLASVGLGLAAIHGALLGLDTTVPTSLGQLLVPFVSSYRPLWVGFGQLTLYLMAAVIASFYMRKRIGQRAWRILHYLTFLSFIGATAHGLMAGTDTGGWGRWIYLGAIVPVVFLFAYRIVMSMGKPRVTVRPDPVSAPRIAPRPGIPSPRATLPEA